MVNHLDMRKALSRPGKRFFRILLLTLQSQSLSFRSPLLATLVSTSPLAFADLFSIILFFYYILFTATCVSICLP